jgi:hypothetical protein
MRVGEKKRVITSLFMEIVMYFALDRIYNWILNFNFAKVKIIFIYLFYI